MNKDFFVMLATQSGEYVPMIDEDDEVSFYSTIESAKKDAEDNPLGSHFGYEIFKLGEGVIS